MYAQDVTPLYEGIHGGAAIGSITPGTAVTPSVGPQAGGVREAVIVEGWSAQGAGSVLYAAPDQRIILATLTAGAVTQRKLLEQRRDDYGTVWKHVQISGYVSSKHLVPDVATVWSAGQELYDARCSACHALHAPTEFTANQWPGILQTMVKNAALDPEQATLVTRYLQAHARQQ